MTPEEFKKMAQELYDKHAGYAGEDGHMAIDCLLSECLKSLGYQEGLDILWSMRSIWYA